MSLRITTLKLNTLAADPSVPEDGEVWYNSTSDVLKIRRNGVTYIVHAEKVNSTTSDPLVGNDNTENYEIGSRWLNTSSQREWVCLDASTGAAVWVETTVSTDVSASYVVVATTSSLSNERALAAGTGLLLTDAGPGGNITFDIDDNVVAMVSGTTFTGITEHNAGLSGSLTQLTDGRSFIVAGDLITITSTSNGQIIVTANVQAETGADPGASYVVMGVTSSLPNERALTAGSGILLTDAGAGAAATLAINDNIVATVSGTTFTGITNHNAGLSGSLTQLTDGRSYIAAGANVTITSSSNGQVIVASAGSGADPGAQYVVMATTASLPNERALTVGTGLNLTDAGAGNNVTFAIDDNIVATVSGTRFTGPVTGAAGLYLSGAQLQFTPEPSSASITFGVTASIISAIDETSTQYELIGCGAWDNAYLNIGEPGLGESIGHRIGFQNRTETTGTFSASGSLVALQNSYTKHNETVTIDDTITKVLVDPVMTDSTYIFEVSSIFTAIGRNVGKVARMLRAATFLYSSSGLILLDTLTLRDDITNGGPTWDANIYFSGSNIVNYVTGAVGESMAWRCQSTTTWFGDGDTPLPPTFYPSDVPNLNEFWIADPVYMTLSASGTGNTLKNYVIGWTGSNGHILISSASDAPWLESSSLYNSGQPYVRFDSVIKTAMFCSTITGSTSGTPMWNFFIWRQDLAASFDTLYNFEDTVSGYKGACYGIGSDFGVRISAGANAGDNYSTPRGVWNRARAMYSTGATGSYLALRDTLVSGNAASTYGNGLILGDVRARTEGISASLACFGVWTQEPNMTQQIQLDAWAASQYGNYATSSNPTALNYVTGSKVLLYNRSDMGIDMWSTHATLVEGWNDLSGNDNHWGPSPSGTSRYPTFVASGGPNGHPYISGDGGLQHFTSSFSGSGSGVKASTNPVTLWMIARNRTWTVNDTWFARTDNIFEASLGIMNASTSPRFFPYNGINPPTGSHEGQPGHWFRARAYFDGTAPAAPGRFKCGSGEFGEYAFNFGNNTPYIGAALLGRPRIGTACVHGDIIEFMYYDGKFTDDEDAQLDAYVLSRYNILTDPASYVPWTDETDCILALRGDVVTASGDDVVTWDDQSGNGYHFTGDGGVGTYPQYSGSGGDGPLGHAYVTGDGVDDALYNGSISASLGAAPNDESVFVWMIIRQDSWTQLDRIYSAGTTGASTLCMYQYDSTPRLSIYNGTTVTNTSGSLNEWKRVCAYYAATTEDLLRFGNSVKEGTSAGNSTPTYGLGLFSGRTTNGTVATQWSDVSISEFLIFKNKNPEECDRLRERLDQYASYRYGLVNI